MTEVRSALVIKEDLLAYKPDSLIHLPLVFTVDHIISYFKHYLKQHDCKWQIHH